MRFGFLEMKLLRPVLMNFAFLGFDNVGLLLRHILTLTLVSLELCLQKLDLRQLLFDYTIVFLLNSL